MSSSLYPTSLRAYLVSPSLIWDKGRETENRKKIRGEKILHKKKGRTGEKELREAFEQYVRISIRRSVTAHVSYVGVGVMNSHWDIIRDISLPSRFCHSMISSMSTYSHVPFELWNEVSHNFCCILQENDKFWKRWG